MGVQAQHHNAKKPKLRVIKRTRARAKTALIEGKSSKALMIEN